VPSGALLALPLTRAVLLLLEVAPTPSKGRVPWEDASVRIATIIQVVKIPATAIAPTIRERRIELLPLLLLSILGRTAQLADT
jgi:hypothetical protein